MEIVWIATMATAIGGILVLAYRIEQAVAALHRYIDRRRGGDGQAPELLTVSKLRDRGEAGAAAIQLVDVRRVGLTYPGNRVDAESPYAMALLDAAGDGVLITAREGPGESAVTALPILGGRSEADLTAWEIAAVDEALRSAN